MSRETEIFLAYTVAMLFLLIGLAFLMIAAMGGSQGPLWPQYGFAICLAIAFGSGVFMFLMVIFDLFRDRS